MPKVDVAICTSVEILSSCCTSSKFRCEKPLQLVSHVVPVESCCEQMD